MSGKKTQDRISPDKLPASANIPRTELRIAELLERIERSGKKDTISGYLLQETGVSTLAEAVVDSGLLEVCKFINQILDDMEEDELRQ